MWPTIDKYARQYGFDSKVLAAIIDQESTFKNYIVHFDGTGHGLLGPDDGGLLPDFEAWVRNNKSGQTNFYVGRGANAISIQPEWQIEYAAMKLASYSQLYGGDYVAARAWHSGVGGRNIADAFQYETLIRNHVAELF